MCKTNFVLSTELILKDATCQREKQTLKSQDLSGYFFLQKYYEYNIFSFSRYINIDTQDIEVACIYTSPFLKKRFKLIASIYMLIVFCNSL